MKNKIYKYDFLIVGAGLIGTIAALALVQKKYKVLVVDKKNQILRDNRTLAVNANSTDLLKKLGIWKLLKSKPEPINKIVIKDNKNPKPLIFENKYESMGNVIFNKEMYAVSKKKLENLKILKVDNNIESNTILPNKILNINKSNYLFKKVIISIGKNVITNKNHKSITFDQKQYSYVGFFKHSVDHKNIAYEFFTNNGPLAILPSPAVNKHKSTFIYTSKEKINKFQLQKFIYKKISKTHGKLDFDISISKFPITPHLIKNHDSFIYIGDSFKSIHPVAGQGWNLGIKDVQTLCKLLDQYSVESKELNSLYYSRRIIESTIYLGFTNILNLIYENKNPLNDKIIKVGFTSLKNFKFLRNMFIQQAMGRTSLTD